jgi:DNA-binding transcriptional MerR regulator
MDVISEDTASGRTDPPAERVLSLANVARMFRVPQVTLRYYEFRGLIKRRHTLGGVRVYGWADCERLVFIIKCRKAGLTLGEIVSILEGADDDASPLQFKTGQETCLALMEQLEERRRVVDEALAELKYAGTLLKTKLEDTRD